MIKKSNSTNSRMCGEETFRVEIPKEQENCQLPNPDLLTYYKDLGDRIIWIDHDIDESILEYGKYILRWNQEDHNIPVEERKPIKILVYSYGGDLNACFTLLNIIKLSKTPVYTYNLGVAMSAGGLILLAGHKRFCTERSTMLIHSGSGSQSGNYEEVKAQSKDYDHSVGLMKKFIMERTNIDQKTLNKHKALDWYIYAEEQVSLGIVDAIVEDISELYNA